MSATHLDSPAIDETLTEAGTRFVRWGVPIFVFGLFIGFGPWLHYMHGAMEEVHPAFLHNVTLWFGCPWTLAVYVTQLGGLAMVVFGLCYLVLARARGKPPTAAERAAPMVCAIGILGEFVFGYPGYFVVNAVWPNFYYTPIAAGKWTWLGIQGACIAIFFVGSLYAYGGIKRALAAAST
jgi:hypothetical protein